MRLLDVLVAVLIIGLCAFAVVKQLGTDPLEPYEGNLIRQLEVGETLDGDVHLVDIGGVRRRIGDWFGSRATVIYSFSTTCACIPKCEEELRTVLARFGGDKEGITWLGVAGEPTDTKEGIIDLMVDLGAFYKMVLDPGQLLCRRLGFDRAALVALLDENGTIRYRGNLIDDLKEPTRNYLGEAMERLLVEEEISPWETPPTFGCAFNAPIEDCEEDGAEDVDWADPGQPGS